MNRTYRRYHSELKIQFANNTADGNTLRIIPRSTRQRWKHLSVHSFRMTKEWDQMITRVPDYKNIYRCVRVLLYLINIQKQILQSCSLTYQQFMIVKPCLERLMRHMNPGYRDRIRNYLPFSFKQWSAWNSRKVCAASLVQLCRRKHPAQLSVGEVLVIREECSHSRFRQWPLSSVYFQLVREQKVNCSLSSFYKYCRLLNITRKKVRKPVCYTPLTCSAPLRMLHMDVTLFKTVNGVKHYLYLIRDNYSRAILACKTATVYSSTIAKDTLEEVLLRFGIMEREGTLITDGGSENKGALMQWLAKPGMLWKKIIAQVDIIQSNSMAEAANKILKYRYLFPNPVSDTSELVSVLDKALTDYNNMPQKNLHGLTPNEVINGAIPDKYRFRTQIAAARKKRVSINQAVACTDECSP